MELMKKHPVFSALKDGDISDLEKYFSMQVIEEGSVIISANETKNQLFFIASGKITGTLRLPGDIERQHSRYMPGDFFGEISFFAGKPSFDTFIAAEKSVLIVIGRDEFAELVEKNPELSVRFVTTLMSMTVERFRASSRFFADVVQWGEQASRRVITDELTGLYNRAFLDDALLNFFEISKSNSKPLALFMMDIDNFRTINSELSHECGNGVLREFVGIIHGITSRHGIIARYGGDEFSILLPEANLPRALEIAEELRKGVDEHDFSKFLQGKSLKISTSIGISVFPDTATELDVFREQADASLYRAKKEGKNRIAWPEER
jgi:diguanylate cyclase (GGDEF)-like protein